MCVAAIALDASPRWKLLAIGNRDEYHARPTLPLMKWNSGILAGLDIQAGGTWLGVGPGRFALVTNRRAAGWPRAGMASRGALVTNYLEGKAIGDTAAMNPFNLITVGPEGARLMSNFPGHDERDLAAGIHTLSNGGLDESWHKERFLAENLRSWLPGGGNPEELLDRLGYADPGTAEADSPFSTVFIIDPEYGTRCSTVMAVDCAGRGLIVERSFDYMGRTTGTVKLVFNWP